MKILITEDNEKKLAKVVKFLQDEGLKKDDILVARNLVDFGKMLSEEVDICVIDIRIPAYDGAEPNQNGIGILQALASRPNSRVKSLAISAFPDEFEKLRPIFEKQGCIIANYHQEDTWKGALKVLLLQRAAKETFDFIIFTALREERTPYNLLADEEGTISTRDGVTRYDISIGGKSGSVIELPRMGLVDAAIIAGRCIQLYSPKLVAMSGICGGFSKNAQLGQLLVADPVYEYQSGKWTSDGFRSEPYQIPLSEKLRTVIWAILEEDGILQSLEEGWRHDRPSKVSDPLVAPFTSGSAVIANAEHLENVSQFHRKVAGLDMEAYAVYRAAHLSGTSPNVFCAKVVVDLADQDKDDSLHRYGSHISARFVTNVVREFFDEHNSELAGS